MDKYDCTIEEREEYELHIQEGNLLFAGVDYEMILREAEKEADVILWDGGNNDASFFAPNLQITIADALRRGHEVKYYPGETNIRMADMIMINKCNSLPEMEAAYDQAEKLRKVVGDNVPILFANSLVHAEGKGLTAEEAANLVRDKRCLVIDDGPTVSASTQAGICTNLRILLMDDSTHLELGLAFPHLHYSYQLQHWPHQSSHTAACPSELALFWPRICRLARLLTRIHMQRDHSSKF